MHQYTCKCTRLRLLQQVEATKSQGLTWLHPALGKLLAHDVCMRSTLLLFKRSFWASSTVCTDSVVCSIRRTDFVLNFGCADRVTPTVHTGRARGFIRACTHTHADNKRANATCASINSPPLLRITELLQPDFIFPSFREENW